MIGATGAAQSAAKTASDTLRDYQESFRIEQRPYLIASPPAFADKTPIASDSNLRTNISFANIGHTTAFNFFNVTDIKLVRGISPRIAEEKLEGKFDALFKKWIEPTMTTGQGKIDIAPNNYNFTSKELTNEKLSSVTPSYIKSGATIVVFFGTLKYVGFRSDKNPGVEYQTDFCWFFFGDDIRTWHLCGNHNTIR